MTMPGWVLLLALISCTVAILRACNPRKRDALGGDLENPQHREVAAPPAIPPGAEGARFDSDASRLIAILAALFALWFLLSGWSV